jgi:hypothetical protein
MEKGVAVPNIKTWGVEGGMLFRQKETYNIFSLFTFLQKKKLKICLEGPLSYPKVIFVMGVHKGSFMYYL